MRYLIATGIVLLLASFLFKSKNSGVNPVPPPEYDKVKAKAVSMRARLNGLYLEKPSDSLLYSAGTQLHLFLVDSVFPYWYGTPWDFNGYTDEPGEGIVACGYFVTTPLRHVGFNLNRYKLAQQYSHSIVNTLCSAPSRISGHDNFLDAVYDFEDGLYIVGLDNHVGFISCEASGDYFIHSSYVSPVCVVKEPVNTSEALSYSKSFVIGQFSRNTSIIRKWLSNDIITIVP